jgi:hypothetical protein
LRLCPFESRQKEQDHGATGFLSHGNPGGAWVIGVKLAEEVLRAYLNARFSTDEDFRRRVRKLEELERFRPEK